MTARSTNVSQLIRHGESFLQKCGVPNARRNAEWLLAHVLACRSADLYLDAEYTPATPEIAAYDRLLERRGSREPLQYILGTTEFMSLPFYSFPGVFIPRPDTEILVEKIERHLEASGNSTYRVADLCCGSGVIAVSLLKRTAGTTVTAVDVSAAAIDVTERNAQLNGVSDRVEYVCDDAIRFLERNTEPFDVIACNPPYIPTGDIASLAPEIQEHEPRIGLDGGDRGLDFYCAIVGGLRRSLRPRGIVGFEIGAGQAGSVRAILAGESLSDVEVYKDYAGNDRVVIAKTP